MHQGPGYMLLSVRVMCSRVVEAELQVCAVVICRQSGDGNDDTTGTQSRAVRSEGLSLAAALPNQVAMLQIAAGACSDSNVVQNMS